MINIERNNINLKPGQVATGAIGVNLRKAKNLKAPDFTGQIQTELGELRISIWALINPEGGKFISFSIDQPNSFPFKNKDAEIKPEELTSWVSALFATSKGK